MDYASTLVPARTRELYQESVSRFTKVAFGNTALFAYVNTNMYVGAIQKAGSFDPDAVAAVFNDPNYRFDYFGWENQKLGGREYYGIARAAPFPLGLSQIRNGKSVQIDFTMMEIP